MQVSGRTADLHSGPSNDESSETVDKGGSGGGGLERAGEEKSFENETEKGDEINMGESNVLGIR